MKKFNASYTLLLPLLFLTGSLWAGPVYAGTCTSPTGKEADIIYNQAYHTYQFCNGTNWTAYGGGGSCSPVSSGYAPTIPTGIGYFVITKTTYNGNLGGLYGADAACLTELTTNTGWKGYAAANANGQLIASKVHAFLCDDLAGGSCLCGNLMPLTTYYFANAGNSVAGGASFITDSNGDGPNDAANWSAANYFSGTYVYWSQRYYSGTTAWPLTCTQFGSGGRCSGFTTSSSGDAAIAGVASETGQYRWMSWISYTCDKSLPLICFVNP